MSCTTVFVVHPCILEKKTGELSIVDAICGFMLFSDDSFIKTKDVLFNVTAWLTLYSVCITKDISL